MNLVGMNKGGLEIGCATGQLSRWLSENGCEVIGIEINREMAEIAKKYCRDVLISDIEAIEDLPYLDFDFILLLDVLEHLRNPFALLQKSTTYLKKGGSIVISLPNVANWMVRWNLSFGRFEYSERGILDGTHLRFFNEKSAKRLLVDAGFEIVKYDIIPSLPLVKMRAKFMYIISKLRPNFFAVQFLLVGRIKSLSFDLHNRKMDVLDEA